MTGLKSYLTGLSAEDAVVRKYQRSGFAIVAQRFQSAEGEIDVIARHGEKYYFVEVKQSKTFARALDHLLPRQIERIRNAALCFLQKSEIPLETEMRFDAALVDGQGQIKVITNAF